MAVNVERIIERADAQLKRLERQQLLRLREVTNRAYTALVIEIRRRWPEAVAESAGMTRTFAEARARVLLAQLEPYLRALEWSTPASGVPDLVRSMIVTGHTTGAETAAALLAAYGPVATATASIDFRAIEAAVTNSQARLARYSREAIEKIEEAVVDGIVRGSGSQVIARGVREAIRGDARVPNGGLHTRAETIARTELATARTTATKARYAEVGVELVQWYATLDERTCPYCGYRHGKVYKLGEATVPAHARCRCYLAPFRGEWLEDGLVDVDYWQASEAEMEQIVPDQNRGATPFEKANGQPTPKVAWTPTSGLQA